MLTMLGEAALRTLLLAAVLQFIIGVLRIRQARLLLAMWTIILAASIAMPGLPRFIPVSFSWNAELSKPLIEGAANLLQQPSLPVLPGEGSGLEFQAQPSSGPWLEAVYAVVGCGMLLRVLVGVGLSFRLLARAVPVRPEWGKGYPIRISRDITGPVTIAHVILLPTDAADWSVQMRQAVLAHERAHVARWDFALLVVSQLNRALFWFSPVSWWLHRRLVTLTELASDDQAMAATRDYLGYAEILLEMGRRSGPTSQGLAMARPSTLFYRIDRILLDQVNLVPISQSQQVLLMVGVAGLSLGIAGLADGPSSDLASTLPIARWSSQNEGPDLPALPIPRQESVALQGTSPEASSAPTMRLAGMETTTGAQFPLASPHQVPAMLAGAGAQPTRSATLVPGPAVRNSSRATSVVTPSRAADRPSLAATRRARSNELPDPQGFDARGTPVLSANRSDNTLKSNTRAENEVASSLSHQVGYGSSSVQAGLEGIAGSNCSGTVAVGMRAMGGQGGLPNKPNVVAGQTVPARAEFFKKDNGMLWVRFTAFGQSPLDLPVRFARNGMTWTGEYGITYTVQPEGGNHLGGLAALVANDSARLDFACSRSGRHLS